MPSGWMVEPEFSADLRLFDRVLLSAGAAYRHIAQVVGNGSSLTLGAGTGAGVQTPYANGGGASLMR